MTTEVTVTGGGHVQLDEAPTGELPRAEVASGAGDVPAGAG